MSEDFEKVNKQIAAFIVVSAALTAPTVFQAQYVASQAADPVGMISPNPTVMPVRYAGPPMPGPSPTPIPEPVRYAGPPMPHPSPTPIPEPVRYAGPPMPHPSPTPIPEPCRYAGPAGINTDATLNINNGIQNNQNFNVNDANVQTLGSGHFMFR